MKNQVLDYRGYDNLYIPSKGEFMLPWPADIVPPSAGTSVRIRFRPTNPETGRRRKRDSFKRARFLGVEEINGLWEDSEYVLLFRKG